MEVSTETLLPPSKVLPEVSSLPSVTEVLVLLSDVEVFEDEAFFPKGVLWEILADSASVPAEHDFQDPAVLDWSPRCHRLRECHQATSPGTE